MNRGTSEQKNTVSDWYNCYMVMADGSERRVGTVSLGLNPETRDTDAAFIEMGAEELGERFKRGLLYFQKSEPVGRKGIVAAPLD